MTSTSNNSFSELYSAYAAGCLDPAFALLVETQSAIRPDIKSAVRFSEAISGVFLESEEAAELSFINAEAVLGRIEAMDAIDARANQAAALAGAAVEELLNLPEPLREHVLTISGQRDWQSPGPGIRRLPLDIGSGLETEVYRIAPGATVPRHSHAGHEYTLVVSGGFTDETGAYGPGDLTVKTDADTHRPVGDPGEPCYVLAVRDGGMRFTGVMGLIQKVLGA